MPFLPNKHYIQKLPPQPTPTTIGGQGFAPACSTVSNITFFCSFYTIRRFQHINTAHIFTTKTFWCYCNIYIISCYYFFVYNIAGVLSFLYLLLKRVFYYGFSQISFFISLSNTFIYSLLQKSPVICTSCPISKKIQSPYLYLDK